MHAYNTCTKCAHLADGLELVLLSGGEHSQHILVHVHLNLLPSLQLLTQPQICLTRVQLPPVNPKKIYTPFCPESFEILHFRDLWVAT